MSTTAPVQLPVPAAAAREALLAARTPAGRWEGRLASSALATATAILALHEVQRRQAAAAVDADAVASALADNGAAWLVATQNADGGWGDTPACTSNMSTTALCWAALGVGGLNEGVRQSVMRSERWLERTMKGLAPPQIARALKARYGKDRTFSVPILTALAIAGRLGPDGWRVVPQLPFELAALPHQWFGAVRLPVVSYALPALIAIGQARHAARPTRNPLARVARQAATARTLRTLEAIQPASGGFLEATPLTSFVVMSLAAAGRADSAVVARGIQFIRDSARPDGSWPIDTDLTIWLTTLAINAIAAGGRVDAHLSGGERGALLAWLVAQQYREAHPYTHAAPGGWAWTDRPGGVPDADDTAGALLALASLGGTADPGARDAAARGVRWLIDLQNRDGGMPTFCRGWTGLPFDRSGADLTAHAVRAWLAWRASLPALAPAIDRALEASGRYLTGVQRANGAFEPLWFGNETTPGERNLTYGTARVLPALRGLAGRAVAGADQAALAATTWLRAAQHRDGGWGGDLEPVRCTIEETAVAVAALADGIPDGVVDPACVSRGLAWLQQATGDGRTFPEAPIGLYFANLWYSERLYPTIFTVHALEAAARVLG